MGRAAAFERYGRWFRDPPTWLSPENQEVGEYVIEHAEQITTTILKGGRRIPPPCSDDLIQDALLAAVEAVREAQRKGEELDPLTARRAVGAAIEHGRYHFARAQRTERPEYREPGQLEERQ
jgi:hypothetical protein